MDFVEYIDMEIKEAREEAFAEAREEALAEARKEVWKFVRESPR